MEPQKSSIAKTILREKNKARGMAPPEFRQYRATVIKTVCYWQKSRHGSMEQNSKPRNKSTHLWPTNLQQRRQEYTMEKRQSLQQWCWKSWTAACISNSMKFKHTLIHPYKTQQKNKLKMV